MIYSSTFTMLSCVCMCCAKIRNFNIVYILNFYDHQIIYETRIELNLLGGIFIVLYFHFCLFIHLASFQTHLKLYIYVYICIFYKCKDDKFPNLPTNNKIHFPNKTHSHCLVVRESFNP